MRRRDRQLAAAQAASTRAAIGILYVVGTDYTPRDYLKTALRYGVKFIRYAFSPGWMAERENWAYLEDAKAAGLTVSMNLMKTYTAPVAQVAKWAAEARTHGCDWFYIVDSAGGMTPASVREYTRAILDASGLEVGLHAHNNGGLALANSLAAVEAGATLVDTTLQGIGRATGNASTEQMLLALQRLGHEVDVERDPIFRLGDLARGLFAEQGNDPTWFASGASQLHSRVVTEFRKVAKERAVSERDLLIHVGRTAAQRNLLEQESFAADIMEDAIRKAAPAAAQGAPAPVVAAIERAVTRASTATLAEVCDELFVLARKRRKSSVLHLVDAATAPFGTPLSWQSDRLVGVTVPISATSVAAIPADRHPDLVVADPALPDAALPPAGARLRVPLTRILTEGSLDVLEEWTETRQATAWIPTDQGAVLAALTTAATERGVRVSSQRPATPRILVAPAQGAALELALSLERGDAALLIGPMSSSARDTVARLRERGVTALRPTLGPVIAAIVARRRAIRARLGEPLVPVTFDKTAVVDPALAPATGEIVVDSLADPTRVVDGQSPSAIHAVAVERARLLFNGRGTL